MLTGRLYRERGKMSGMEKAYRYRFYPTTEQESLLRRTLGCVRLVFGAPVDFVECAASTAGLSKQRGY